MSQSIPAETASLAELRSGKWGGLARLRGLAGPACSQIWAKLKESMRRDQRGSEEKLTNYFQVRGRIPVGFIVLRHKPKHFL